MYKTWLFYTCKWATKGLDSKEMKYWHELTTHLEKHCPDCGKTLECSTCRNTGLNLTLTEVLMLDNIERSLAANKVNTVN